MYNCSFCAEINNHQDNNPFLSKIKSVLNIDSRFLFETENWLVIPTIGSIVPGYLLVISKEHYVSIGACPSNKILELDNLIKTVRHVIYEIYKLPIICFEHGAVSQYHRGGCCVDHAHLHLVPLEGELLTDNLKQKFVTCTINSLEALNYYYINKKPYLLYQDNLENNYVLFNELIPSQYFRQLIAIKMGCAEKWDWRHYTFIENIQDTILNVKYEFLNEIHSKLLENSNKSLC